MKRPDPDYKVSVLGVPSIPSNDLSSPLNPGAVSDGCLIVLVSLHSNYGAVTQQTWELALATGKHVKLLGLCKDLGNELSLRRQLITMTALVQEARISVEAMLEVGANWIDVIKRTYQTGDVIVCSAEERDGFLHKPLSQVLEENLNAPIFILSALYPRRVLFSPLLLWVGFISIISCAFLVQVHIISLTSNGRQTALMIISTIVELWLIWGWNSLFG